MASNITPSKPTTPSGSTKNGSSSKKSSKNNASANRIKQIRNCTHMAVTHLAEKLKPVTPQLELLHDMCFHFMKNRQYDIFELLTANATNPEPDPIGEIGVTYIDMKGEKPPAHYEVLKKSVSGKDGDLARHGSRKTYLYFRRSTEQKPITALTLISPDNGEEPPLGFEMIYKTPGSRDADLIYRGRNSLFVCVHRGDGPPITRLGIVHIKKEKVPVGWHHIQRTPNGKTPELDQGGTVLAYKRDYQSVILRFARYARSGNYGDELLARCFACLVGGIYSFDRQTFLYALEAFTSLDTIKKFPTGILADFVSLVRDALTAYISFFNREVYVKVLKWLGHVYQTRAKQLDTRAFMSMLHLCMFLRHEDSREYIGKFILQGVIRQSRAQRKYKSSSSPAEHNGDAEAPASVTLWLSGLVGELGEHVAVTKSTQHQVTRYLNTKVVDSEFHEWVSVWLDSMFESHFDRFMAASITLLAKVSAQQLPTKLTAKSEVIKRRIHALKLLAFFLEECRFFFKNHVSALVLLRRIVFTSFIHSAITAVPAVFKTMFRLHEILWVQYRQYLKFEIGVLLDVGMVGLLQSQFCTPPQKVDLLEGFMQMFRNKAALINIFYNYDNDIYNWPVCQNMINVVAKLTEGEYFTSNHYKAPEHRVVQGALRLLARFMELMARYLRAPGLNKGGNLDGQEDFDKLGTDFGFSYDDGMYEHEQSAGPPAPKSDGAASLFSGDGAEANNKQRRGSQHSQEELQALATLDPTQRLLAGGGGGGAGGSQKGADALSVSSFGDDASQAMSGSDHLSDKSPGGGSGGSGGSGASKGDHHPQQPQQQQLILEAKSGDPIASTTLATAPTSLHGGTPTDFHGLKDEDHAELSEAEPTIRLHDTLEQSEQDRSILEKQTAIEAEAMPSVNGRQIRSGTWAIRYDQHMEETRVVQLALKKAAQDKLKTAIKFLLAQGGRYASLKFIATFLYANETLDKEEVGEFISSLETSALSLQQHRDLLLLYLSLLSFTGQVFDTAFRHFLTDCGFNLPKEAQKIDRLMDAFAHAFVRDNPHVFDSTDQALVLSYGVLMLNTELHNPKARQAAMASSGPMSRAQFGALVQSGDTTLSKDMCDELYDSIKENPIEMKTFHEYQNEDVQAVQKQFRNECSRLVQKALAKLREHAKRKHSWQKARQRDIVRALYEVTWLRFVAAVTTVLRQTKDPQTQSVCLDAIKYSCAAAICLGLNEPQLHAFACALAEFVFFEQNKHLSQNACHLATVRGEHLRQHWFLNLMNFAPKSKPVACEVVSHICNDMQARVIYDADQKILRDIEMELGSNLHLINPDRRFIHAGPLTKQSSKGDLDLYRFYLFNDLLIYVSGNPGSLNVHRVLHLSLCKILDLRDGFIRNVKNAFRIVSPQKPILLIASTAQEKHEWFQLVQSAIQEQVELRARWINANFDKLQEDHETARISKYLGRDAPKKKHERERVQNGKTIMDSKLLNPDVKYEMDALDRDPPCKLCQRPFKRFTRKAKCPWCFDIVCKECLKRKTQLPSDNVLNKKSRSMKVCDGCFGAINYFIAEMNNTDAEFSATETMATSTNTTTHNSMPSLPPYAAVQHSQQPSQASALMQYMNNNNTSVGKK